MLNLIKVMVFKLWGIFHRPASDAGKYLVVAPDGSISAAASVQGATVAFDDATGALQITAGEE